MAYRNSISEGEEKNRSSASNIRHLKERMYWVCRILQPSVILCPCDESLWQEGHLLCGWGKQLRQIKMHPGPMSTCWPPRVQLREQESGIIAPHSKLQVTVGNRTETLAPGVYVAQTACAYLGMKMGQIKDVISTPSDCTCKMGHHHL